LSENSLAWRIWNIANLSDRPITQVGLGPIPSTAIIALCEIYGATLEDFEKVLILEGMYFQNLQKKEKDKKEKDPGKQPVVPKKKRKK